MIDTQLPKNIQNDNCKINYEYHDFVECITSALDARDPYTGKHSERVSDIACFISKHMGLSEDEIREIHIAGHLHDIGKIGIPDRVLLKESNLDDEEWEMMKKHPQIGADILSKSPHFLRLAAIIVHHHERWDGNGYPFGAKGDEIPIGARIIAICDSIDAMASKRAYRDALPLSVCKQEIEKNKGIMYDPKIVEIALKNWDELISVSNLKNQEQYRN